MGGASLAQAHPAGEAPARPAFARPVPAMPAPTFTLASEALGEERRINVYLPPGYGAQPQARFPVLYMPDGGMAEDFPHVTATVQSLVASGAMRPFLVVGIENTERRRDMTGPTEVESDRKIAPRVGGSAAFRTFLRRELMPEIRARYRTTGETGIVGESLAGLFVMETFFLEPDLFDTYIAISPSLWWNHDSLVRGAAERLKARPVLHQTLYMTAADEEDIVADTKRIASLLEAGAPAGLRWFYEPMPDEHHGTIFRAAEAKAYRKVFAAAPGKP